MLISVKDAVRVVEYNYRRSRKEDTIVKRTTILATEQVELKVFMSFPRFQDQYES
jgi:hypothetical protein